MTLGVKSKIMDRAIDVEREFDVFVRNYGGTVVKGTLSRSPSFDNADYVFPMHKIVVELKYLQDDKLEDKAFPAKVALYWAKWVGRGVVLGRSSLKQGPCSC